MPRRARGGSARPTPAWLAALVAVLLAGPALAQLPGSSPPPARGLPSLGDAGAMTPLEERKLGDAIVRELYRDPDYLDDPVVGEYVDGIWRALLAAARARGELPAELDERYAWQVLLGRDRSINAFALPGGYFGLHLGLVGAVASRDELASVLAHELTHITQRHIPRLLAQEQRQTPLLMAAMVAGMIAASKNPQAGTALAVGGQAALIQQQLNFSRDMEREADRIGYGVMTQAGFAGQGFVSMFEKLQAASRINDNGDWPYLRSHPLTTQRIADMQQRQQGLRRGGEPAGAATDPASALSGGGGADASAPRGGTEPPPGRPQAASAPSGSSAAGAAAQRGGTEPPPGRPQAASAPSGGSAAGAAAQRGGADLEALLVAARARVLGRPGVDVLRAWAGEPEAPGFAGQPLARRASALYAAALAQAQLRDLPRAQALATQLALAVAGDVRAARQARLLQAELALQAGQPARVLELLAEPERPPAAAGDVRGQAGRAALLLRAQAQTRLGQGADAAGALQSWVADHPHDAGAWQALAQAHASQGQTLRALRAEGEVPMARMDYAGAVDRWRAAQDVARRAPGSAGDLIEISIVDTRLRQAQALLRQQQLDEQKRK